MSAKFKIILAIFIFAIGGYYYLFHPYKVVGRPISPFIKGQTVLASKLAFYFKEPKVGDRVIFYPEKGAMEYVGIIKSIDSEKNVLIYNVDSSEEENNWQLSRDKISSYIWYPL